VSLASRLRRSQTRPSLGDLLCMTRRMSGNQQQNLHAIDRARYQWMISKPESQLVREFLHKSHRLGARPLKVAKSLAQTLETARRPPLLRGLDWPGAVCGACREPFLPGLILRRLLAKRSAGQPREQKSLRDGHVLHTFQDRPSAGDRFSPCKTIVHSSQGRVQRIRPSFKARSNSCFSGSSTQTPPQTTVILKIAVSFAPRLMPMPQDESITSEPVFSIRIRVASEADRPRLIRLINSAFAIETFFEGTRTDEDRLAAMMQKGVILAAEDAAGGLLGCVYTEVRGARGYLGQLAVDPAHQGLGLGRRIFQAGEGHLRRQGCEAVDILVLSLRPELPPIYRRFGYIETGTEKFSTSRGLKSGAECHCIVMSKKLE